MPEALLALQRCLAGLALDPDAAAFEADPAGLAAAHGLPAPDQAAFERFRDRLLFYRQGVRGAIREPLETLFPLTQAVLGEDAWDACCGAFLATRSLASPFYRDIAPTFLGWLVDTGWGLDRWPFLHQLAHYELVKELVEQGPAPGADPALHAAPGPGDRLALAPTTLVLTYAYRVHVATVARPGPPPGTCHLLASRGPDGYIQWRVLTAGAAALLVRAQAEPVAAAAAALGMPGPEALAFLEGLRDAGAIAGFRGG